MYHPNARGTGFAMKLELEPAEGEVDGSISVTLAPQSGTASRMQNETTNPRFDWENVVIAKLCITDISRFIMVFRGIEESISDGKGLIHVSALSRKTIKFWHMIEPRPGYLLEITDVPSDGKNVKCGRFFLNNAEAMCICSIFEQSLSMLAFGVPTFEGGE